MVKTGEALSLTSPAQVLSNAGELNTLKGTNETVLQSTWSAEVRAGKCLYPVGSHRRATDAFDAVGKHQYGVLSNVPASIHTGNRKSRPSWAQMSRRDQQRWNEADGKVIQPALATESTDSILIIQFLRASHATRPILIPDGLSRSCSLCQKSLF